MKIDELTRFQGKKACILRVLENDINNHRFECIQQLYEAAQITNQELIKQLKENRNIPLSFVDLIYWDIILILSERVCNNPSVEDLFLKIYSDRFLKVMRIFDKYKTTHSIDKEFEKLSDVEKHFFIYNTLLLNEIWINAKVIEECIKEMKMRYYVDDSNELKNKINNFTFTNSDEKVFFSTYFDRYIMNRKEDISKYLNIPVDKLEDTIHNNIRNISKNHVINFKSDIYGRVTNSMLNLIADNNGAILWPFEIISKPSRELIGYDYRPDVNTIIKNYYTSLVLAKYINMGNSKQNFSKCTLSRDCKSDSVETDYLCILYMYEADVIYKMFSIMLEEFYKNFSWEQITRHNYIERYKSIITNLEQINISKDTLIATLAEEKDLLSLQVVSGKDDIRQQYTHEINQLFKQIKQKDDEINSLKYKIEIQNKYIEEISKPEIDDIDEIINLSLLQEKKYLFVGDAQHLFPQLKKDFPNSIFMDRDTLKISDIKVDAIILLIKFMSHSMYYKVKTSNNLIELPSIATYSKNINRIYYDMYQYFY